MYSACRYPALVCDILYESTSNPGEAFRQNYTRRNGPEGSHVGHVADQLYSARLSVLLVPLVELLPYVIPCSPPMNVAGSSSVP
jgi:hypothetical protein